MKRRKEVEEVRKSAERQEKLFKEEEAKTLNRLDLTKKDYDRYRQSVLTEARSLLLNQQFPKGYVAMFQLTRKGLVLWIRDRGGKFHANGMLISQNPLYDAQAMIRLIDNGLIYADLREEKDAATDVRQ